jgi:hypothetical protein
MSTNTLHLSSQRLVLQSIYLKYTRLIQSTLDFHPYTFGYNGEGLKHYDQVLTHKDDVGSFQTLDYMFELNASNYINISSNKLVEKKVYKYLN